MIGAPLWALLAVASPLRVAVLVGNASGSPERAPLRHTTRDVLAVREVLEELGGVSRSLVVLDRDPEALRAAWRELSAVLGPHAGESTVFFYYSGHASEAGLEMGEARYAYAELRQALHGTGAQLFVAVIDACQAGLMTRAKGGRPVQLVDLSRFDGAEGQRGGVLITSGAPDELTQESDELGGSFFTHYLLSGLRGAADDSGDRRVSLEEAYRFAYLHTVDRTGTTLLGAQHPSWDLDVRGRGPVVLTWLEEGVSAAVLPAAAVGRFLVRDRATGRLAVELTKRAGKPLWVALEPGPYEVVRVTSDEVSATELRVEPGRAEAVVLERFVRRPRSYAAPKGGAAAAAWAWSAGGALESGYLAEAAAAVGARARARWRALDHLDVGAAVGATSARWSRADGLAVTLTQVGGGLFADAVAPAVGPLELRLGVEARAAWAHQTAPGFPANDGLVVTPLARAGAALAVTDALSVGLGGELGVVLFDRDGGLAARPQVGAELWLELRP